MADAQLDIVLSAKDISQQAFNSLNNNVKGIGGSLDALKSAFSGLATGYGVFKTLGQALESAKLGSTLDKQATAFTNLSDAAGTSSKRMLESLKASSQGLIAEADLMGAAGKAMLMNIPAERISDLMKIAAATSKMTGQSITEAFNDITMGVARQSRMILDNLGIIVNVDDANAKYAKTLGTTADALNDAQKRQAFMNAVLEAGNDMIRRLGSSSGALNGVNELVAAQTNLWNDVNKTVAQFLDKELSGYARMLNWIDEKLKGMRTSAGEMTKSDAWKEIDMLRSLEAKGMAQPGTTARKEAEFNARFLTPQFGLKRAEELKRTGSFSTPAWSSAGWREREGNFAANTEEQNKQIVKDREEWLKKLAEEAKKAEEEVKKLHDEVKKLEDEFADSKIFSGESSNYEKMQAQLRSGAQLSDQENRRIETESEAWAKEAQKWNDNLMERVSEYEKTHKKIVDLSVATAEAMQTNFSNLFFDAFTGKLKSLEDYATAVFQSLARMVSDLMSQQLTRGLFGADMRGGGWLSQLFGTSAANLPINTPGAFAGVQPFHSGGIVGSEGGPGRGVPAWMFDGAPRYHSGIGPGERGAILRDGEGVFTPGQMRALGAGKGGGDTIHIYNITAMDSQSVEQALRRSGAVPALAAENYANNGIMRTVLRGTP